MWQEKSRKLSFPRKKRTLMMEPDYLNVVLEAGVGEILAK
jgi:hypothetical protein